MTEAFVQEFEARAGTATAEGPEWLEPVRRAAMERFARTGFPGAAGRGVALHRRRRRSRRASWRAGDRRRRRA